MSSFKRAFPAGSAGLEVGGYFGALDCLLVSISEMVGMKVLTAPIVEAFAEDGESWIGRVSDAVEDMTGLAGLVERPVKAGALAFEAGGGVGGESEEEVLEEGVDEESEVVNFGFEIGEDINGFVLETLVALSFRGDGETEESICLAQRAATLVTTPPFPPRAERTSYLVSDN